MDENEIPRFIKKRGCINCDASKGHKEKTGNDFGFDHELMTSCILSGCQYYGFSLASPFTDPEELIQLVKTKYPDKVGNAIRYCQEVNKKFGWYYKQLGISLDKIISSI